MEMNFLLFKQFLGTKNYFCLTFQPPVMKCKQEKAKIFAGRM